MAEFIAEYLNRVIHSAPVVVALVILSCVIATINEILRYKKSKTEDDE